MEFNEGDTVKLGGSSLWPGAEGVVLEKRDLDFQMRVTKRGNSPWSIGSVITPASKSVVAVVEEAYPRKVKRADVKVGDTVRVTYPELKVTEFGVTSKVSRIHEGEVRKMSGKSLYASDYGLINSSFAGLDDATYEILKRAPKSWVETAEIGDKFLLTDEGGNTLFVKERPYDWTIHFNGTKESRYSASVQGMWGTADVIKL